MLSLAFFCHGLISRVSQGTSFNVALREWKMMQQECCAQKDPVMCAMCSANSSSSATLTKRFNPNKDPLKAKDSWRFFYLDFSVNARHSMVHPLESPALALASLSLEPLCRFLDAVRVKMVTECPGDRMIFSGQKGSDFRLTFLGCKLRVFLSTSWKWATCHIKRSSPRGFP